jgi:pyruvate-formate lyase-activating enzyme
MKVDKGFNLYVDVTASCNAACPFCIAPTIGRSNDGDFLQGLRWALDFTQNNYGSVQVTGGEPTLSVRLPKVIREIRERMFHRVVLNTNGTGIKTPSLVIDLQASGFTHVNLSRHHYNETKNQEIMRFHRASDASTGAFIRAVELVCQSGMVPRINCNLLRGYIDAVEEIGYFAIWCENLSVRKVAFSETFHLDMYDHQLPIVQGYAEDLSFPLGLLVKDMDGNFEPVRKSASECMATWGQSTWISSFVVGGHRRFWKGPKGVEISIKTMAGWNPDGTPKPPAYSKAEDPELREGELYFAVVHPDGVVSASWDKRERVMFEPVVASVR